MVKIKFYSRKKGWEDGNEIRVFESDVFDLENTLSSVFISKNGKTILDMIMNIYKEKAIPEKFINLCKQYENWFLYEEHCKITEGISL